ncbi:MAG: hypothetical protein M1816_006382 [Peltula sp. TS41687]|nr:MAG: hypothetical protein M1816_006382 [Peltula sp. TS41687]
MAPTRPHLSITLPRNFTFHYTDGQGPRTPERDEQQEPIQPPPLRPYRVRRRRPLNNLHQINGHAPSSTFPRDVPIPSVEIVEPTSAFHRPMITSEGPAEPGLLAPRQTRLRFVTPPPRTMLPKTFADMDDSYMAEHGWSRPEEMDSIGSFSRPTSACSIFSDSSVSSSETSSSFPSTAESCTSPEQDRINLIKGPSPRLNNTNQDRLASAYQDHQSGTSWRGKGHLQQANWTDEMDSHLWTTYLLYLQDPTMTPFRADPGRPPPLGVCHRVAREAKRTWRGSRFMLTQVPEVGGAAGDSRAKHVLRDVHDEANAVGTASLRIPSQTSVKSDTSFSSECEPPKCHVQWPRSEAATRRRLRELSREKDLNYSRLQRALQTRSPTPAGGARPRLASPMGGLGPQTSFSTRNMALTLAASTSHTMRPDGILARLAQDETEGDMDQAEDDWFGLPVETSQAAVPQPSSARMGLTGVGRGNGSTRLGSPLITRRRPESLRASSLRPGSSPRTHFNTFSAHGTTRRSHARISSATLPHPSALKRRAQYQLEHESGPGGIETTRNFLEELLTSPVANARHSQIRNRGFSLNDASAATRLCDIFTPPTTYDPMNRSEFRQTASFANQYQSTGPSSSVRPSQRLASPFPGDMPSHPLPIPANTIPAAESSPTFIGMPSSPMQITASIEQRFEGPDGNDSTPKGSTTLPTGYRY